MYLISRSLHVSCETINGSHYWRFDTINCRCRVCYAHHRASLRTWSSKLTTKHVLLLRNGRWEMKGAKKKKLRDLAGSWKRGTRPWSHDPRFMAGFIVLHVAKILRRTGRKITINNRVNLNELPIIDLAVYY